MEEVGEMMMMMMMMVVGLVPRYAVRFGWVVLGSSVNFVFSSSRFHTYAELSASSSC